MLKALDIANFFVTLSIRAEENDMTHEPGGPWASCYREGALHTIIPQERMKAYFADKLISKPSVDPAKIPRAGYRGKDGVLVLPAEDYCKEDDIYNTYPGKNE